MLTRFAKLYPHFGRDNTHESTLWTLGERQCEDSLDIVPPVGNCRVLVIEKLASDVVQAKTSPARGAAVRRGRRDDSGLGEALGDRVGGQLVEDSQTGRL
jgi:hypothetical protein